MLISRGQCVKSNHCLFFFCSPIQFSNLGGELYRRTCWFHVDSVLRVTTVSPFFCSPIQFSNLGGELYRRTCWFHMDSLLSIATLSYFSVFQSNFIIIARSWVRASSQFRNPRAVAMASEFLNCIGLNGWVVYLILSKAALLPDCIGVGKFLIKNHSHCSDDRLRSFLCPEFWWQWCQCNFADKTPTYRYKLATSLNTLQQHVAQHLQHYSQLPASFNEWLPSIWFLWLI